MPIVTKRLGIILARVDRGFVLRKKGFSGSFKNNGPFSQIMWQEG